MFVPVGLKGLRILWADDQNLGLPVDKFLKVLTQLRHMPLAKWSDKSAVENQKNIGLPFETGQLNYVSLEIR